MHTGVAWGAEDAEDAAVAAAILLPPHSSALVALAAGARQPVQPAAGSICVKLIVGRPAGKNSHNSGTDCAHFAGGSWHRRGAPP